MRLPTPLLQLVSQQIRGFCRTSTCRKDVRPSRTLLVEKLHSKLPFEAIHLRFRQFGKVDRLRLSQPENQPLIAYVTFRRYAGALKAVRAHTMEPIHFSVDVPTPKGKKTRDLPVQLSFCPTPQKDQTRLYKHQVRYIAVSNLADKPQLPSRTIYAGNIHYKMSPAQLRDWFSHWGDVRKVVVVKDRLGQHTGRAFITFVQKSTAEACWRDTDRRVLRNRRIVLEYAKPRGEGKKLFEELLQDQEGSTDVGMIEQREDKIEALRNMPAFDVPPPKSSIKVPSYAS